LGDHGTRFCEVMVLGDHDRLSLPYTGYRTLIPRKSYYFFSRQSGTVTFHPERGHLAAYFNGYFDCPAVTLHSTSFSFICWIKVKDTEPLAYIYSDYQGIFNTQFEFGITKGSFRALLRTYDGTKIIDRQVQYSLPQTPT